MLIPEAKPDPTFHFDADPDPDPDPTPSVSFEHVGKSEVFFTLFTAVPVFMVFSFSSSS
jgi:hypothetical protein